MASSTLSFTSTNSINSDNSEFSNGITIATPDYNLPYSEPANSNSSSIETYADVYRPLHKFGQNKEKKVVKFSSDVKDNESFRRKLIYDKVPITSPPKRPNELIINIDNTNRIWETYYGTSGKFAGDPNEFSQANSNYTNSSKSDYRTVFSSPYFDYRRTHSTVNYILKKT